MKAESFFIRPRPLSQFIDLLAAKTIEKPEPKKDYKIFAGTDEQFFMQAAGEVDDILSKDKREIEDKPKKNKFHTSSKNAFRVYPRKPDQPYYFAEPFSKKLYGNFIKKWKVRDTWPSSVNPYSDIYRDFLKLQVTLDNTSPLPQQVTLWGDAGTFDGTLPTPDQVDHHTVTGTMSAPAGIEPQGIVYNPATEQILVANQISGNISVFNSNNQLVQVVQLLPSLPGLTSPVAIAINTNSSSSHYGYAYVACSVSNQVAVIDNLLNVVSMITTGTRPLAIAFNPITTSVLTSNLVDNTVTVIDAETLIERPGSPLHTGHNPTGIGVNPENGDSYVANSLDNNLTVFDHTNASVATIAVGIYPTSIIYNPATHAMYAISSKGNSVARINPLTYTVTTTLATGLKPLHGFFDSDNSYLYVQNTGDNTFTIIRPDNTKVDGLHLGNQNTGGAFNPFTHSIYVSDTAHNTVNIIGYLDTTSFITPDPGYAAANAEFRLSPAILQHVKFVVTGQERLSAFRRNRFTVFGTARSTPMSFDALTSPQSTLNVSEAFELAGTLIDNKMNWRFTLPGLQRVTILLWYRQFMMGDFLAASPDLKSLKQSIL